jgi:hypothetical protein
MNLDSQNPQVLAAQSTAKEGAYVVRVHFLFISGCLSSLSSLDNGYSEERQPKANVAVHPYIVRLSITYRPVQLQSIICIL